jgi:hypothetical protein
LNIRITPFASAGMLEKLELLKDPTYPATVGAPAHGQIL